MHQPDAQYAAFLLNTKPLGQIQSVEVSVPGKDSAFAQERRNFRRMVIAQPERQRRAALVKSLRIGYTEDLDARNRKQSFDESRNERRFIPPRRAVRGQQCLAPIFRSRIACRQA